MKQSRPFRVFKVLVVCLLAFFAVPAVAADAILIRGGTLLPVAGDRLEGHDLLVRDGKIAAIGKEPAYRYI